jgi:hypothetical protein
VAAVMVVVCRTCDGPDGRGGNHHGAQNEQHGKNLKRRERDWERNK